MKKNEVLNLKGIEYDTGNHERVEAVYFKNIWKYQTNHY